MERITGYINKAEADGAKILVDGRGQAPQADGYWVGPTVIDGVNPESLPPLKNLSGPIHRPRAQHRCRHQA